MTPQSQPQKHHRYGMKHFLKKHIDTLPDPVSNVIVGYKLNIKGFMDSDIYIEDEDGDMCNFFLCTSNIWWPYCHGHNGNMDPDPNNCYLGLTFSKDLTMEALSKAIKEIEEDKEIQEIKNKFGDNCSQDIRISSYLWDC